MERYLDFLVNVISKCKIAVVEILEKKIKQTEDYFVPHFSNYGLHFSND